MNYIEMKGNNKYYLQNVINLTGRRRQRTTWIIVTVDQSACKIWIRCDKYVCDLFWLICLELDHSLFREDCFAVKCINRVLFTEIGIICVYLILHRSFDCANFVKFDKLYGQECRSVKYVKPGRHYYVM